MAKTSEGVQFGSPNRGKELTARQARGRPCDYPGCMTVLSTYNESSTCWLHTTPSYRHPLYRG
jgi:hypothetical protein